MKSLKELFDICDSDRSGFIGREEVNNLCAEICINPLEASEIFTQLDRDGDGKVSFEDFKAGFEDYISENNNNINNNYLSTLSLNKELHKKKILESRKLSNDTNNLILFNNNNLIATKKDQEEYYKTINYKNSRSICELIEDLEKLKNDNEILHESYQREKNERLHYLQQIEHYVDNQVKDIETKVTEKTIKEFEAERTYRDNLKEKVNQIQIQLSMFDNVYKWLENNNNNSVNEKLCEIKSKLNEALLEKRRLELALLETQSTVAMMKNELKQFKIQYEEKCKELNQEKEYVLNVVHGQDNLARQLLLLQCASKSFEDVHQSFKIWDSTEFSNRSKSGDNLKRGSIVGDYIRNITGVQFDEDSDFKESRSYENSWNQIKVNNEPENIQWYTKSSSDEENDNDLSTVTKDQNLENTNDAQNANSSLSNSLYVSRSRIETFIGPPEQIFSLIFIGNASVGKSSFILRLVKNEFVINLSSTVGIDFHLHNIRLHNRNLSVQLWDTAGQERFQSITKSYFRKADGILLLYDVTNEYSFLSIRNWMFSIQNSAPTSAKTIIVGNKIDLRNNNSGINKFINQEQGENIAKQFGVQYIESSVKSGFNVHEAFIMIVEKMMENDKNDRSDSVFILRREKKKPTCCNK